jgi:hypothetical protein
LRDRRDVIPDVFSDGSLRASLATEGWARMPAMGDASVAALLDVAERTRDDPKIDFRWESQGYDELMCLADLEARRRVQAALEDLVAPYAAVHMPGAEIVVSNLLVKAPRSPSSAVPLHQDASIVDEAAGALSLQLWIPFVDLEDETAGGLMVIPRTHVVPHPYRAIGDRTPFHGHLDAVRARAVRPRLRAGEPLVFTGRTLHGSTPHLAASLRYALGLMLVAKGTPLVHYVRKSPVEVEEWTIDAEALRRLSPGRLAEGRYVRSLVHEDPNLDGAGFAAWAAAA